MRIKHSFAAAVAAAVAAVGFSAAFQPAQAAIFTWRTGGPGAGDPDVWSNGDNWQGGTAYVSGTENSASFKSSTVTGSQIATPDDSASIYQLLIDGTTSYDFVGGTSPLLFVAPGGGVSVTSSTTQYLPRLANIDSGTISLTSSGPGLTYISEASFDASDLTVAGAGAFRVQAGARFVPNNLILNGNLETAATLGSAAQFVGADLQSGNFTSLDSSLFAALDVNGPISFGPGLTISAPIAAGNAIMISAGTLAYGGATLNLDLTNLADLSDPSLEGTVVTQLFAANAYTGNLSDILSSGPGIYSGLDWTPVGDNWWSSRYGAGPSGNFFEFQPATGNLVVVPEPAHMTLVAGLGAAAFGAWRMRRRSTLSREAAHSC